MRRYVAVVLFRSCNVLLTVFSPSCFPQYKHWVKTDGGSTKQSVRIRALSFEYSDFLLHSTFLWQTACHDFISERTFAQVVAQLAEYESALTHLDEGVDLPWDVSLHSQHLSAWTTNAVQSHLDFTTVDRGMAAGWVARVQELIRLTENRVSAVIRYWIDDPCTCMYTYTHVIENMHLFWSLAASL